MAQIEFDIKKLQRGLSQLQDKVELQTRAYADTAAMSLQNELKKPEGVRFREPDEHHTRDEYRAMGAAGERLKWRDRTGEARRRIKAYSSRYEKGYKITLAHGVWYGIYLEKSFSGVYAVIDPAIKTKGQEILKGWARLLKRLSI